MNLVDPKLLDKMVDHHRLIRDVLHAKRVQLHFIGTAVWRHSSASRANQFAGPMLTRDKPSGPIISFTGGSKISQIMVNSGKFNFEGCGWGFWLRIWLLGFGVGSGFGSGFGGGPGAGVLGTSGGPFGVGASARLVPEHQAVKWQ